MMTDGSKGQKEEQREFGLRGDVEYELRKKGVHLCVVSVSIPLLMSVNDSLLRSTVHYFRYKA